MFRTVFAQIWRNMILRIAILGIIALIFFAVAIRGRMRIQNFFERLFSGSIYHDPMTWKKGAYGFEAQPEKALRSYVIGLRELAEMAIDLYDEEEPDRLFKRTPGLTGEWYEPLDETAVKAVNALFSDLHLLCEPLRSVTSIREDWRHEERLKKRHLKKSAEIIPFNFAVTEDNRQSLAGDLLSLDMKYFRFALGKKPDFTAVLRLRDEINRATCRQERSSFGWMSAIQFREYDAERRLVTEENAADAEAPPERISEAVFGGLRGDREYRLLLKEFYFRAYPVTEDLPWKKMQSNSSLAFTGDASFLPGALESILMLSRTGDRAAAERSFRELYALESPGIEKNPYYVYALAETSWRAGMYRRARTLVSRIMKEAIWADAAELNRARRLDFILELSGY